MAIVQALLALLSRSVGRIVSAVFGWAVVALFGETNRTTKVWLSALVGAAAAWPVLVVGTASPRVAALVLAFVPLPKSIPDWTVRVGWILLSLAVPLALGLILATRRPVRSAASPDPGSDTASEAPAGTGAHAAQGSSIGRLARGFPITIGLSAAFLITAVTVPALRVASFLRRRIELHVPLVSEADAYEAVASEVARTLTAQGFAVSPAPAPWWMTAPSRLLRWADPASFEAYVPRRLAYYRGPRLEAALYPSALLLRGVERDVASAHGLLAEALIATPGLQTFDPGAQDIERQIRRVWRVHRRNPAAHRHSRALMARLTEIAAEIRRLPVTHDEWQIIYRQALQLGRALDGQRQLLERTSTAGTEGTMTDRVPHDAGFATPTAKASAAHARELTTRELLAEIAGTVSLLVKKEVELAKTEAKADLEAELAMVKTVAAGLAAGLLGVNALVVAVVFGLATQMPGWLAALVVGGSLLLIAAVLGYLGWSRRVTAPLSVTRKTVKEDLQWAKELVA